MESGLTREGLSLTCFQSWRGLTTEDLGQRFRAKRRDQPLARVEWVEASTAAVASCLTKIDRRRPLKPATLVSAWQVYCLWNVHFGKTSMRITGGTATSVVRKSSLSDYRGRRAIQRCNEEDVGEEQRAHATRSRALCMTSKM